MLCDKCKKRMATFHQVVSLNGVSKQTHLCNVCASQEGLIEEMKNNFESNLFEDNFFNTDIFGEPSFFDSIMEKNNKVFLNDTNSNDDICEYCGTTFNDYLTHSRSGCTACRKIYQDKISKLITDVKIKDLNVNQTTMQMLKNKLNVAIEKEDYEEASRLKKEIEKLNSSNNQSNKNDLNNEDKNKNDKKDN